MKLKTARTIILGLSLVVLGVGFGYELRGWSSSMLEKGISAGSRPDMSMFWGVWDTLERTYVDPAEIKTQSLMDGAIEGMVAGLDDPYTVYLPPQQNQESKENLNGEFGGVGIQLAYIKNTVAVQTPMKDQPAIKAGVKAGDLILHIKDTEKGIDKDTSGMTLQEAVTAIRGKKGTSVTLTFYREDKGSFELTIVRDTIVVPSVELVFGEWKKDKFEEADSGSVAWLKLSRFGENTDQQWDQAVTEISSRRSQLKGVVLDLRNNPGGFLDEAVDIASEFIPEGLVLKQVGRVESKDYEVTKRARLLGIPLTVLINEGSASASEILAGALRDRLGTKLVGQKSFGKGVVQQVIELKGGAGLHVTAAKWFLPKGDWIHEKGIAPTVEVKLPELATGAAEIVDTQLKTAIEEL